MEQAPYGVQTQSYPKGGLLDSLCPASSAPSTLGPEQDFQMFPKARLSTVSVNYCSVSQDFPAGSLNPRLLCVLHWQAGSYHCTAWETPSI